MKFEKLQNNINYQFEDIDLLREALTHPSKKSAFGGKDYERMEFLGDSVLSLAISEILYQKYKDEREGSLAKRRAALICRDKLAIVAKEIGLDREILLGKGEEQTGGRENKANLENCLEALIAAIYLDGGLSSVKKVISILFNKHISEHIEPPKDPKSQLQEYTQSQGLGLPEYEVVSVSGPDHEPIIEVSVTFQDHQIKQKASSKRKAEKIAAEKLLELLGID
jgi:ribonuclease-3